MNVASLDGSFDPLVATATHRQGNFVISTRKLPISKAGPIAELETRLGIPVPEMIFGDNLVAVEHAPSGWRVEFGAGDALDAVDKTGANMLKVAYARSWTSSREGGAAMAGVKEVVRPFDWSYSTDYRGTVVLRGEEGWEGTNRTNRTNGENENKENENKENEIKENEIKENEIKENEIKENRENRKDSTGEKSSSHGNTNEKSGDSNDNGNDNPPHSPLRFRPTETTIPLDLLRRRDPIRFFDEVVLYESELDDNGISLLSVKVRVHDERMLLLSRLFMRLDGVVVRVRDTRLYVDFTTDEVLREYTAREEKFEVVKRTLLMSGQLPDDVTISMKDPNVLSSLLPVVEQRLESVSLPSQRRD